MLQGCYPAWATPFHPCEGVNYGALKQEMEYTLRHCHGGVLGGCTGLASLLADDELLGMIRFAVDALDELEMSKKLIIPGISRDNPYETVAFGQKIMNASGLTTFLIKSPSTVKPTQAGIIRYYETIADRLGRHAPGAKIIIYSVPSRTGGDGIKPDTAIALAQHPNIAALKDASRTRYPKSEEGDAKYTDDMARIIEETKKFGFTLLSGDDDRTHNLMEVGAKGSISVAANVDPRRVSRMVDLCLDGNYDAAALINGELNPLYRALFVESNPIPLHYALERLGIPAGNPRLPMTPATQETRALMNEVLSGLNLI